VIAYADSDPREHAQVVVDLADPVHPRHGGARG
jgi:hypothetical protein